LTINPPGLLASAAKAPPNYRNYLFQQEADNKFAACKLARV